MDALPEAFGVSGFCKSKNKPKSTCTIRTKCTESVRMAHLVHVLFHSQSILEGKYMKRTETEKYFEKDGAAG
jgi:hypothetical protein